MERFLSTKTFPPISAAFRQHGAESHCRFIHGYGLVVKLTFAANVLDTRNWVVDFGGLKGIRMWLEDQFDHKLLVAADDPALEYLEALDELGLAQVRVVPAVGCEAFARMVGKHVEAWLRDSGIAPRVTLIACEVREHEANSAIYNPEE